MLLTPAGAAFLTAAREILATLDRGVTAARNAARVISGILSVGISLTAGGDTRSMLLTGFERAYPQVDMRLATFDLTERPAACSTGPAMSRCSTLRWPPPGSSCGR